MKLHMIRYVGAGVPQNIGRTGWMEAEELCDVVHVLADRHPARIGRRVLRQLGPRYRRQRALFGVLSSQ
jgi:hypothetical protein